MTEVKPAEIKPPKVTKPKAEYVSKDEFKKLESTVTDALTLIMGQLQKLDKPEPHPEFSEPEIKSASQEKDPINPRFTEKVHEILGPEFGVDVYYPDSGGTLFTVIVPREKSNASQSFWESHKDQKFAQDRRTKNIGNTGIEGVIKWCQLIKTNLERKR